MPVRFSPQIMAGSMKFGGVRPAFFSVEVFNPVDPAALLDVPIKAKATTKPPSVTASVPVWYKGRPIKLSGDREFPPWTVTFYADEDDIILDSFERWNNALNAHVANTPGASIGNIPSNYKGSALFIPETKTEIVRRIYEFVGMYPINVGEMQHDFESANQISTFDVTFDYDFWTCDRTTDSTLSINLGT